MDLGDPGAVKAAVATIQRDLGTIDVLFWNPVGVAASFRKATPEETIGAYNVTVTGASRCRCRCSCRCGYRCRPWDLPGTKGLSKQWGVGMTCGSVCWQPAASKGSAAAVAAAACCCSTSQSFMSCVNSIHHPVQPALAAP